MPQWLKEFGPSLFALLKRALTLLSGYVAYVMGRRSQRGDQLEKDLKAQKEYGRIASENRTADDASDRLRGGDF